MSRNSRKSGHKLLVLLGTLMLVLSACDPCRSFAEKKCDCEEDTEDGRRRCRANLSLSESHINFKAAKDVNMCLQALQECSCKNIIDGDDTKCGMYR
jgi:hypothetical protein